MFAADIAQMRRQIRSKKIPKLQIVCRTVVQS